MCPGVPCSLKMLVGAAHRPFLDQAAKAQPWLQVREAAALLPAE